MELAWGSRAEQGSAWGHGTHKGVFSEPERAVDGVPVVHPDPGQARGQLAILGREPSFRDAEWSSEKPSLLGGRLPPTRHLGAATGSACREDKHM
jgi:hypothetical protein